MTTKSKRVNPEHVREVTFDKPTLEYLADVYRAELKAVSDARVPYLQERQTIMRHFMRIHALPGNWEPKPDGSGLIRTDATMPEPPKLPEGGDFVRKPRKK
jgi:hypothetical protein